jgi:hypothetical protein
MIWLWAILAIIDAAGFLLLWQLNRKPSYGTSGALGLALVVVFVMAVADIAGVIATLVWWILK